MNVHDLLRLHGSRLRALAPLRHPHFRLFFAGPAVSLVGSWMQSIGHAWLVLQLTHSAFWLGVVSALQWGPVLVLSLPAGVLVDRFAKRALVLWTQTLFCLLAFVLGLLAVFGAVRYWHVAVLAVCFGIVNALDVPARQSLVVELVEGTDDLTSGIALNSALFSAARLIGPGIGGLAIAAWGVGVAFLANAASFLAVIGAMCIMRGMPTHRVASWTGLLDRMEAGVRFVVRTPPVFWVLVVLTILGLFPANYNIFIPVLAYAQLHVGASGFGLLTAVNGAGSMLGGILVAAKGQSIPRRAYLYWSAVLLSAATMALSWAVRPDTAAAFLFLAGCSMTIFSSVANSTIQFDTPDMLRGRVMSIYSLIWNGTTPFGALLMGALCGTWGLSAAVLVGGGAGLLGTLGVHAILRRWRRPRVPVSLAGPRVR